MTQKEHYNLNHEYRMKSIEAIRRFEEAGNYGDFEEYMKYHRLANKHFGIAQMMHTKKMKKLEVI